jgi:hypothetical protein
MSTLASIAELSIDKQLKTIKLLPSVRTSLALKD